MIGDFVKGRKKFDYPDAIRKGIELHRSIDEFTDHHVATQNIKMLFRSDYGLYAGAFADIVYDYCLANDPAVFSNKKILLDFTKETYKQLATREDYLPERFKNMLAKMQEQNWLYHYHSDYGMMQSFSGLKRRAKYINQVEKAFETFCKNKTTIKEWYDIFFPEVTERVKLFIGK